MLINSDESLRQNICEKKKEGRKKRREEGYVEERK